MSGEQWTAECLPGGNGQCDGYHYGGVFDGQPCGCPCHQADDLPTTTAEVKAWHDNLHNLNRVPSGRGPNGEWTDN